MTKNEYYEMAENFAMYANTEVSYKSLNLHYNSERRGDKKFNVKRATLMGVGILGNAECFILADFGRRIAIHYSNISFPRK